MQVGLISCRVPVRARFAAPEASCARRWLNVRVSCLRSAHGVRTCARPVEPIIVDPASDRHRFANSQCERPKPSAKHGSKAAVTAAVAHRPVRVIPQWPCVRIQAPTRSSRRWRRSVLRRSRGQPAAGPVGPVSVVARTQRMP
jgi:hypothetical protein